MEEPQQQAVKKKRVYPSSNETSLYLVYGDTRVAFDTQFSVQLVDRLLAIHGGEILTVFEDVVTEKLAADLRGVVHELIARLPKRGEDEKDEQEK